MGYSSMQARFYGGARPYVDSSTSPTQAPRNWGCVPWLVVVPLLFE